ncbi:MAG: hypothetical protein RL885_21110 [Planctomycetota bacterium]
MFGRAFLAVVSVATGIVFVWLALTEVGEFKQSLTPWALLIASVLLFVLAGTVAKGAFQRAPREIDQMSVKGWRGVPPAPDRSATDESVDDVDQLRGAEEMGSRAGSKGPSGS